jgi:hypothetical protein
MKFLTHCLLAICANSAWGCCPPDNISIIASKVDGECVLDLDYEGTALGIYVSEPIVTAAPSKALGKEVEYPRGPNTFEGIVFFGLDTTTFPDGIVPPVRYGDTSKARSKDTTNGYMHSDDDTYNKDATTNQPTYALHYPMPLLNEEENCVRCQLSAVDELGTDVASKAVGPFKIGIVTVPGNAESDPLTDFRCPADDQPIQYGTELTPHFGAD